MAKIFYDHLVEIEEVFIELDKFELTKEEKEEFVALIDETLHQQLLNVILSNLPTELQEMFLDQFYKAPYRPELLDFVKEKATIDIEKTIREEALKIKKEILADIKRSKKR